jgi:predicted O-methyltransferase YrrM
MLMASTALATLLRRLSGRAPPAVSTFKNADEGFHVAYERARACTMTSQERMHAVYQAARYLARRGVAGDYVECGVWRGGSSMMAAAGFIAEADVDRRIWLYDTFDGMPPPSSRDVRYDGLAAEQLLADESREPHTVNTWALATLEDVRANMKATGYPAGRIEYVTGQVEETIPATAPEEISLLRLDTDWYESTRHELVHLWPRLVPGGVLIIDDYGWWQGAKEAVDEYFADEPQLLMRIDGDGRLAVKT